MNAAAIMRQLRNYSPPSGRSALAERLRYLAVAGNDDACATYFDLRPPSLRSPLHARTTYLLADLVVNGGANLPLPMDTVVPSRWRVLVAAGLGRMQDVGLSLTPSMAAAPDSLLGQVCTCIAAPDRLPVETLRQAEQILWRLGAKRDLLRLCEVRPEPELIATVRTSDRPSAVASIFFIQYGTSDKLEEALLRRAADRVLEISERVRLVRFVLTRRGKARQPANDRLARAYQAAMTILQDLGNSTDVGQFCVSMLSSTLHRAMAFHPFLDGRTGLAIEHLLEADALLAAQRPCNAALQLLLSDHHFPALETLSQTASMIGRHDLAVEAAHRLVAVDPHDARSWFALGKVMIGRADLLGAAAAFTSGASCEIAQKARACYFAAVAYAEAGHMGSAKDWLHRSATLDPTPSAIESLSGAW